MGAWLLLVPQTNQHIVEREELQLQVSVVAAELSESQRQLHSYKAELSKAQEKLRQVAGVVEARLETYVCQATTDSLHKAAPKLREAIQQAFAQAQTATVVGQAPVADLGDAAF